MRTAKVERKTLETEVSLELNLDGQGKYEIDTSLPLLDHLLSQLALHGLLDLNLAARGDTEIDDHHLVEDIGIALGQALSQALGERRGIARYSHQIVPMDETLVLVALDISGRGLLAYQVEFPAERVGAFEADLIREFLRALAMNARLTLHIELLAGLNGHHIAEALFKALGRALDQAAQIDERRAGIPSSKGAL